MNINQARLLGEKYGIRNSFTSLDELLNFDHIDILHVVTPPHLHFDQAAKAIDKGIHVLIEKPITLNYNDTRKLYALSEEKNVKICPNYIHLLTLLFLKQNSYSENDLAGLLVLNLSCLMI
jgi:predicted dehydrogenase